MATNNRSQTARDAQLALQLRADPGGTAHTPQALCPLLVINQHRAIIGRCEWGLHVLRVA